MGTNLIIIIINACGESIRAFVTPANQADNSEKTLRRLFRTLKGYVYADKGFIDQKIVEEFYQKGLRTITGIRASMKNKLIEMKHKLLWRKRGVIEAVNDILKQAVILNVLVTEVRQACLLIPM